jgi:hypothetical protein
VDGLRTLALGLVVAGACCCACTPRADLPAGASRGTSAALADAGHPDGVARWIRGFDNDTAALTAAILALRRGEGTGLPVTGPAPSLAESGRRASAVLHGHISRVGAEPSGLMSMEIEQAESAPSTVTLRAVITSAPDGLSIVHSAGQFLPTALSEVVVVTDRIEGVDFPQPETGVYLVAADGTVVPQDGSPLRNAVRGMSVDDLLAALGAR